MQAENAKNEIRNQFEEKTIVFMDVVGSTLFKQEHQSDSETLILRVKQFSEILAMVVTMTKGVVVKYIGDEVMAYYDSPLDALNLLNRLDEIEQQLHVGTGFETKIKVSVDFGEVYMLHF